MRGLLSLIDSGVHSHALFMDDDASCEAESIARTYALLQYSRDSKTAVAGSLLRMLDTRRMRQESATHLADLQIGVGSVTQPVETLSGGQRQGVAVARSAAFARHVVIMDEPTAALGVKESGMVLQLIRNVRDRGLAVVLISHDMPHVFEIADRIHVQRLGKRVAVLNPKRISMSDTVAVMTGALRAEDLAPDALA